MAKQVRVLGTTDETTTCECCGKTNLKKVIVLDIEGDVVRFGSDCAAKALTPAAPMKVAHNAKNLWNNAVWANSCVPRGYRLEQFSYIAGQGA